MLKKVGILANGGDVSGFNAVIRAIVKTAENNGIECYGIKAEGRQYDYGILLQQMLYLQESPQMA